jgi:hypothetical protein
MLASVVVDYRPFDGSCPLAVLVAADSFDLCRLSLQRAHEISLVVGQALGRTVIDPNHEGVGVETHSVLSLVLLL